MLAHKINVVFPEDHQLVIEVPTTFRSGPAELILLAPTDDPSAPPVPRGKSRLADLAAELAQDPRPFEQLSPEEKRARLARIRGSARGLLTPSAEFARRKADEMEIEERKLGSRNADVFDACAILAWLLDDEGAVGVNDLAANPPAG